MFELSEVFNLSERDLFWLVSPFAYVVKLCLHAEVVIPVLNGHTRRRGKFCYITAPSWLHSPSEFCLFALFVVSMQLIVQIQMWR